MTKDPQGHERLVGVLSTSDNLDIASAGEVSGQLGWIRSVSGV